MRRSPAKAQTVIAMSIGLNCIILRKRLRLLRVQLALGGLRSSLSLRHLLVEPRGTLPLRRGAYVGRGERRRGEVDGLVRES